MAGLSNDDDRAHGLRYTRDMLPQLKRLSGASEGSFLAYLFDMTGLEVDAELRRAEARSWATAGVSEQK